MPSGCSKREFGAPARFHLSAERCRWTLQSTEVDSIPEALDELFPKRQWRTSSNDPGTYPEITRVSSWSEV
jgi:hypothetical protein